MKKILIMLLVICFACILQAKTIIYDEAGNKEIKSYPNGWMGDYNNMRVMFRSYEKPKSGKNCIKIRVNNNLNEKGWCGIYWNYTDYKNGRRETNWGQFDDHLNLQDAKKLIFYARGAKGGEIISFKAGGVNDEKFEYKDSFEAFLNNGVPVRLSKRWKKYVIDLQYKNLTHVIGTFCFIVVNGDNKNDIVFYIDEIYYK